MNVANLQIEGLILAVAFLNKALVDQGVLSRDEIGQALKEAEAVATSDEHLSEGMSPPERHAVCFAIRALKIANDTLAGANLNFSELARAVGRTKPPYNDQL
jgi:hypothetical protein